MSELCPLSHKKPCCQGRGYRLTAVGPQVQAEVCECVESCRVCLGYSQVVQKNKSRACRSPSPRKSVSCLNNAAIPARYIDVELLGFSNFSGSGAEVVDQLRSWLSLYDQNPEKGLVLSGPVGVGKTYLLTALAKSLALSGVSVKFIDFFQLLSEIRSCYSEHRSDRELLQPLLEVDVLFIDEMGKGRNTDFELVILDQLVMGRYNQNRAIVASTNCYLHSRTETQKRQLYDIPLDQTPEQAGTSGFASSQFGTLESRVGERIFSRLLETCTMLDLSGRDFRRQGKT